VITSRPATSLEDLRLAESILSEAWLHDGPFVASHPGDLEWWHALAAPDDLAMHLRLWNEDGALVGWSWVREHQVHWEIRHDVAGVPGSRLETILTAAIAETAGALHAWVPEDDPTTLGVLARHGFRPKADRLSQFQRRLGRDAPLAGATLAAGYRIRHVAGDAELPARMAIHRAAFEHSRMTLVQYERLVTLPHYTFEDDLVVEAPDGSLAAFAMAWWDPVARVGEFEPVGTHPDHQRRGLGRALLTYGLERYRDRGAAVVQIYSHADNAASEGLYQAVGFDRRRYCRQFERPADGVRSAI